MSRAQAEQRALALVQSEEGDTVSVERLLDIALQTSTAVVGGLSTELIVQLLRKLWAASPKTASVDLDDRSAWHRLPSAQRLCLVKLHTQLEDLQQEVLELQQQQSLSDTEIQRATTTALDAEVQVGSYRSQLTAAQCEVETLQEIGSKLKQQHREQHHRLVYLEGQVRHQAEDLDSTREALAAKSQALDALRLEQATADAECKQLTTQVAVLRSQLEAQEVRSCKRQKLEDQRLQLNVTQTENSWLKAQHEQDLARLQQLESTTTELRREIMTCQLLSLK